MSTQSSTTLSHFANYAAAPDAERFAPATLAELREIAAELAACDPAAEGDVADVSDDLALLTETVIPAAERGVEILVGRDEDGYYFARRAAESETFAVLVPCEEVPVYDDDGNLQGYELCPDSSGIRHTHVAEDVMCGCGSPIALEGVMTEGDDEPFFRCRELDGDWSVRCSDCGAKHTLTLR